MAAIVFIILQIFFATRTVLKIGEYHSGCPRYLLLLKGGDRQSAPKVFLKLIFRCSRTMDVKSQDEY